MIGLIAVIIVCIQYVFAAMNKGSTQMKKPSRIKSFTTTTPLDKVMKTLIHFAQSSGYKVDDFNESDAILVLSDSASLTSYGFFYPVYLSKQSDGKTVVNIGIKSKAFQLGPIVSRNHEKCFNGIKTALYAES